jgi:hypothetical protein
MPMNGDGTRGCSKVQSEARVVGDYEWRWSTTRGEARVGPHPPFSLPPSLPPSLSPSLPLSLCSAPFPPGTSSHLSVIVLDRGESTNF